MLEDRDQRSAVAGQIRRLLLFSVVCSLFMGCAAGKPPSTAAVHQSISVVGSKIDSASTGAAKAKSSVAAAILAANRGDLAQTKLELQVARSVIDDLTNDLMQAKTAATSAETKLQAFDKKNAKFAAESAKLRDSRHRWVKFSLFSGIGLLSSVLWIFKGPLLSTAGFIARKFAGIPI